MSTDTIEVPATSEPAPLTLKDRTARLAQLTSLQSALKIAVDNERADLERAMIAKYDEDNARSFSAKVGGHVVADFTLKKGSDKVIVSDEKALLEWALDHAPSEVETIVQVRESFVKVLIKNGKHSGDGEVVNPDTAEVIPGLKFIKGEDLAGGFQTSWKKVGEDQTPGQRIALDALRENDEALLMIEGPAGE